MDTAIVSPKYEVKLPTSICEALDIMPGQKVAFVRYGGTIRLLPEMSPEKVRGALKGLDTNVEREPDRIL